MDAKDKELMLQDWLRLVDFGEKAIKYNKDKGQITDTMELTRRPGGKDSVGSYKRLSDLSDFRFFSLGAIYTHCQVPFDIMGAFRDTLEAGNDPYTGPRLVLEFKTPIIRDLEAWSHILEGVWLGPEGYDKLVKFVTTQTIRQKAAGRFWTFKHVELAIPDPMEVDRGTYNPMDPEKQAVIGLFLPSGNSYQVTQGIVGATPPMNLLRCSPDPAVVREAQAMLTVGI